MLLKNIVSDDWSTLHLHLGYHYTAYMDYIDLDVRCPRKAVNLNYSLHLHFRIMLIQ